MVKGCGEDQLRTLLDHILHRGGRASFVGDVLSFDDLDTLDILLYFHDGFMHGLVVAGIGDRTAVQRADGQAGSLFHGGFGGCRRGFGGRRGFRRGGGLFHRCFGDCLSAGAEQHHGAQHENSKSI